MAAPAKPATSKYRMASLPAPRQETTTNSHRNATICRIASLANCGRPSLLQQRLSQCFPACSVGTADHPAIGAGRAVVAAVEACGKAAGLAVQQPAGGVVPWQQPA